jgi:M6 family metalloprotease-like protein
MITQLATLAGAVAAVEDPARKRIWIVEGGQPGLASFDLDAAQLDRLIGFPSPPSGIALSGDRSEVLIAFSDGRIVSVDANSPGAMTPVATVPQTLGQAAATTPITGRGHALVVSRSSSDVIAVRLSDGQQRSLASIPGLSGVCASARDVYGAATTAGEGRLFKVVTGVAQGVTAGLLPTGTLTVSADHELLLAAHPGADRVSVFRFADGSVTVCATDSPDLDGRIVEMHGLADGRFLLLTERGLAVADDLSDLVSRPRLVPPSAPLFVGSWVPLQYDLSGSGLTDDDISFRVEGDPDAALISHAATTPGPGGVRVPMLVAGGLLGEFEVTMLETSSGTELDRVRFEVVDHWLDPDHGPSKMLVGDSQPPPAGDWGGGPNAPQNLGSQAHNGRWRVLILMVNTTDGSYPTAAAPLAAARKAILDEVQDGIAFGGKTRSARHYYEELSGWNAAAGRGLTIQAYNNRVYGPLALPNGWTSYFAQKKDAAGTVIDERWSSMGATVQTIVSRTISDGLLTTADYGNIDVLLMVPFSPDAPGVGAKRFVWPHANSAQSFLAGTNVSTDQRLFGFIFAPPDFATQDGRQLHSTVSHELGHTLGLPDLYNFPSYAPNVTSRLVPGWDMMGGSRDTLPHYTLSNRMRQGWIDAGHLKLYNFVGQGAKNDTITLHAAELGAPPAGRVRGIEIRLADGWNTYVEYRATQGTQIADSLPTDRRVVITDVTSDSFVTPNSRPPIMFVANDSDGDGPILGVNLDYDDVDPATQKALQVNVVSTAADNAVVNVKYGSNGRPDPGIRPWNGGPDWQSPDIEVRNAKSMADPSRWFNVPWVGNPNTVVAKVRNSGDLLCKGVVVDFFVIEFSTGDGPMVQLGSDTKDIAPNAVAEFTTGWSPVSDTGHYCIVVRIRLYQDPALAGVVETNIYNNEARSNYTRFVSASASPSSRAVANVALANPFEESTIVSAVVRQTHRLHRVYVDHTWLRVPAGESRTVQIFDEALYGFPEADYFDGDITEELWGKDNKVSVEGWAERPFPADCGAPTLTGGAGISVGAGRAVLVEFDSVSLSSATGSVRFLDGGAGQIDGHIVVVARECDERGGVDPIGDRITVDGRVSNGRFGLEFRRTLDADFGLLQAHYLGDFGAAPAESELKLVQR